MPSSVPLLLVVRSEKGTIRPEIVPSKVQTPLDKKHITWNATSLNVFVTRSPDITATKAWRLQTQCQYPCQNGNRVKSGLDVRGNSAAVCQKAPKNRAQHNRFNRGRYILASLENSLDATTTPTYFEAPDLNIGLLAGRTTVERGVALASGSLLRYCRANPGQKLRFGCEHQFHSRVVEYTSSGGQREELYSFYVGG